MIVLIYDSPSVTDVEVEVRAGWIEKIYPKVKVVIAYDGPTVEGYTPYAMKVNEDYVMKIIQENVTHLFSSEQYGDHMSKALGAKDCRVDMRRMQVPISGTMVRQDVMKNKMFLHPIVFKDQIYDKKSCLSRS